MKDTTIYKFSSISASSNCFSKCNAVPQKPWMKTTGGFEGLPAAWAQILVPSAEAMSLPSEDDMLSRF